MGKSYERNDTRSLDEYVAWQDEIVGRACELLADNGSICWQVGNFVRDGSLVPLDIVLYQLFARRGLKLRNRLIWRFNFGRHHDRRFSGRYETILWFTKSDEYKFNLDPVRVPQLYPGKRHASSKRAKAGLPSGNPLGKNPSDYWDFSAERDFVENPVWDLPNVKAGHPEKTVHPCQFPIELAERCVLALTDEKDWVLDPFVGTGSSLIAAAKHQRNGTGIDRDARYLDLARGRIDAFRRGELPMRPSGQPVRRPIDTEKVAQRPLEWAAE
jgi:DNA modification methylase